MKQWANKREMQIKNKKQNDRDETEVKLNKSGERQNRL